MHLNAVQAWLTKTHATARIIEENFGHIENEKDRLTATVEDNVLVQIESLRTHPSVAAVNNVEIPLGNLDHYDAAGKLREGAGALQQVARHAQEGGS